jgi:hypothetical protein
MRGRLLLAKWGLLIGSGAVLAQPPALPQPPIFPPPPRFPQTPARQPSESGPIAPIAPPQMRLLPGDLRNPPGNLSGLSRPGMDAPGMANPIAMAQEVPLPQRENKIAINAGDVSLKRVAGGWQLWAGQRVLRDFGDHETDARDVARVYRDAPPVSGAGAREVIAIDLKSVRVEPIRGVWCVRDDANILFNFGLNKADAEQARAVILHYGFNRVGVVGSQTPVMHYLFGSPDTSSPPLGPVQKLQLQSQIENLGRVGIPVGGVGFVGEMFHFDPRKLEVRKVRGDWIVAAGAEVIGHFGPSEYPAREAVRTIQDGQFTEFCKVGSAGITFFLTDGHAPRHIPFNALGRNFEPSRLATRQINGKWAVTENSRHLLDCTNAEEGEILIRVLKYYQFDQLCHLGLSPRQGVSFFARSR